MRRDQTGRGWRADAGTRGMLLGRHYGAQPGAEHGSDEARCRRWRAIPPVGRVMTTGCYGLTSLYLGTTAHDRKWHQAEVNACPSLRPLMRVKADMLRSRPIQRS